MVLVFRLNKIYLVYGWAIKSIPRRGFINYTNRISGLYQHMYLFKNYLNVMDVG